MTDEPLNPLQRSTRRQFFSRCGVGLGSIALASLMSGNKLGADGLSPFTSPLAPKKPHFAPRAKNVIYLFMAGGPSQLDLFDYKPTLARLNGEPIPPSYIEGKRFAFMDSSFKNKSTLLGTLSRNLPAEEEAMHAGLAPAQVRPSLGASRRSVGPLRRLPSRNRCYWPS